MHIIDKNIFVISTASKALYEKQNFYAGNSYSIKFQKTAIVIENFNSFFPIFIYENNNGDFLISNDVMKLVSQFKSKELDETGLMQFILFNTTLGTRTLYKGLLRYFDVSKIVISKGKYKIEYYSKENKHNVFEQFNMNVNDSIKKKLSNHAVLLSGGGESRINAALSTKFNLKRDFFTWGHPKNKEYIIAKKISNITTTHLNNIRINPQSINYRKYVHETAFLSHMQYSYRISIIDYIKNLGTYDCVWTGWGDINGYPTRYQASELYSEFYLGLYKGKEDIPLGWNINWLKSKKIDDVDIVKKIRNNPSSQTFSEIERTLLAPRIFGQVLAYENLIIKIISPWFNPDIYKATHIEESKRPKILRSKRARTLWKGKLYFNLIRRNAPKLNYVKHSKGYLPWLINPYFGILGLGVAYLQKKFENKRHYPFDSIEDMDFIKIELNKVIESNSDVFDKNGIQSILNKESGLSGVEIFNALKIIQVYWLLDELEVIHA